MSLTEFMAHAELEVVKRVGQKSGLTEDVFGVIARTVGELAGTYDSTRMMLELISEQGSKLSKDELLILIKGMSKVAEDFSRKYYVRNLKGQL